MLDARTGELCYRFDSERLDVEMVVVVDGVLVTDETDHGDALLVARDLTDGGERWSVPANYQGARGYLPGIPAGTGAEIITALAPDGTLEGIALDDGTVRWTAELAVDPDHPPALRDSSTTVAVVDAIGAPGSPRSFVGIDRETGVERWRWRQPAGTIESVDSIFVMTSVDADGHAYLESLPYQPFAPAGTAQVTVDLETGEAAERRQRGPDTTWRRAGLGWDTRTGLGDLTFGFAEDADYASHLTAWNASGGVEWMDDSTELSGPLTTGDGSVAWSSYVADGSRLVTVADAITGQPRWTYDYPAVEKSLDHIMFSDGYLVYGGHTSSD
jgi:outer membrane protein assembly factor BamB